MYGRPKGSKNKVSKSKVSKSKISKTQSVSNPCIIHRLSYVGAKSRSWAIPTSLLINWSRWVEGPVINFVTLDKS